MGVPYTGRYKYRPLYEFQSSQRDQSYINIYYKLYTPVQTRRVPDPNPDEFNGGCGSGSGSRCGIQIRIHKCLAKKTHKKEKNEEIPWFEDFDIIPGELEASPVEILHGGLRRNILQFLTGRFFHPRSWKSRIRVWIQVPESDLDSDL
jgi:hypothetical protein